MHALLFFCSSLGEHLQKKMSSTKQYIQAETSSRIDACFGGVVVEHESHKFQYYQDRNKRWPFTCSEKGCELFVLEKRSKCSRSRIFSSSLNFLSLTERNQNQRHFVVSAFDWSEERGGVLFRLLTLLLLPFGQTLSFILKRKKLDLLVLTELVKENLFTYKLQNILNTIMLH